jgi:hypothetical protein
MSVQVVGRKLVDTFSNVAKKLDATVVLASEIGLHVVPANEELGIESHFQRGMPIKVRGRSKPVIVNLHYYGCSIDDTGKKINFNVEVYEKSVNGRTFTYLDLHKAEGQSVANLKFNIDHPELKGNIKIAGTDAYICIVPRHKAENTEEMGTGDMNKQLDEMIDEMIDDMLDDMIDATTAQTALDRDINNLREQFKKKCERHNA